MRFDKSFLITEENAKEYISKIGNAIKQFLDENKRKGVVLGMSGGIDCSVVARLCQEAGIEVYLSVMPYGDDMERSASYNRAMDIINKFGFDYEVHNIQPVCEASAVSDTHPFIKAAKARELELAVMNRRPRARMMHLYELAQLSERSVLCTGNLDETITGYFTLHGDDAGAYRPLAMLTKREVYILAKALGVPDSIISTAPSAGLYAGQTDEDELGFTYAQIDSFIIDGTSGDAEVDKKIEARYLYSEFKRKPIPCFYG